MYCRIKRTFISLYIALYYILRSTSDKKPQKSEVGMQRKGDESTIPALPG